MRKIIFLVSVAIIFSSVGTAVLAQEEVLEVSDASLEINFFYSLTCPHCIAEQKFLDDLEVDYPDVAVKRYLFNDSQYRSLLLELIEKHDAKDFLGLVPMTFIGEDFFVGFDGVVGNGILTSVNRQLGDGTEELPGAIEQDQERIGGRVTVLNLEELNIPFVGDVDATNLPLPVLAILLGFLDGFNVCSLGALILILSLVIALRSRKKIMALGSVFILTTAVIYGLLIVLWYQLFIYLAPFIGAMEILIGGLAIIAGAYFLNQFWKYRKYGPACETMGGKIVSKIFRRTEAMLKSPRGILGLVGAVFLFAAVVTIVEFPCSAAVPVVFAGMLADAGLSSLAYLLHIALFILFYMLDELIIFVIAVWRMHIWMTSPKFTMWASFVGGVILLVLGGYYLLL